VLDCTTGNSAALSRSVSEQVQVGIQQVAYPPVGYFYFRSAHGAGGDFVSIEHEYEFTVSDAEIVIQPEAVTGEVPGLFRKVLG
jgi:hypothetical protein